MVERTARAGVCAGAALFAAVAWALGGPAAFSASADSCPNAAFLTGASASLPDCRAYELVTPPDKEGARVVGASRVPAGFLAVGVLGDIGNAVAKDGSSVVGASTGAFAGERNDELGALASGYYRFQRTADGWTTTPLQPDRGTLLGVGTSDFVYEPANEGLAVPRLTLVDENATANEIGPVWEPALGAAPALVDKRELNNFPFAVAGAAAEARRGVTFTIGRTTDRWKFDHTINWSKGPPFDETSISPPSLYEYTGTGNEKPILVGVKSGVGNTELESECGTTLGSSGIFINGGTEEESEFNAVSQDGKTIYFTAAGAADGAECPGREPPANEIFARVEGEKTVAISDPSSGDCEACDTGTPRDADFQGASSDGSKVFFTSSQPLLGSDESENLYEYDFNARPGQKLARISSGALEANVQGVTRISEDGSHVYFVAQGVITSEPNRSLAPGQQEAQQGADNLYVYERDARFPEGHVSFVAMLCSDIARSGNAVDSACPSNLAAGAELTDQSLWGLGHGLGGGGGDANRPAQATPDGRFLVFCGYADLTSDDTSSARQVFLYDAQNGTLVRVSKGEQGFNNDGNASLGPGSPDNDAGIVQQNYVQAPRGGALARTMSDDGSYVFFQSPVGLTKGALNDVPLGLNVAGKPEYAQNVYEYHEGHVYLISDGQDVSAGPELMSNVYLIGTSESGSDVFFATADALVPQDTDSQVDFYDARIEGGFPPPPSNTPCQGEGCLGAPSAPPPLPSGASSSASPGDNLLSPSETPAKKLTAKQKLAQALKVCRKNRRRQRAACERQARKRYGMAGAKKHRR
jgi:hypothetical protein